MSERERRNLGEDECCGRELHDACKGPSGKEQRKGTRSVANLVNAIQDSLTCLQLAVFSQSSIYLNEITRCLSASSNPQSISQFNSQSISPARWFVYVIHPPFFLQSAHFVPPKTFSRNKTPLKTHLVQLKTFIRNEIDKNIYGTVTYATRLHKILWLFLAFL